jgi:hypothetical protein
LLPEGCFLVESSLFERIVKIARYFYRYRGKCHRVFLAINKYLNNYCISAFFLPSAKSLIPRHSSNAFTFKHDERVLIQKRCRKKAIAPKLRTSNQQRKHVISPTQLFPGYEFDPATGKISIPISSLGLTTSEANATTGSAMELVRMALDKMAILIAGLDPLAQPIRSVIGKPDPTIAVGFDLPPGTLRQTYVVSFDLQPIVLELVPEPTPPVP